MSPDSRGYQVRETPNVVSRSTRGFPPGPGPNTRAGGTVGLWAENRLSRLHVWHDDSACLHRPRRQPDLRVDLAGTERTPGHVWGRLGESRSLSRRWIPRRGPADR